MKKNLTISLFALCLLISCGKKSSQHNSLSSENTTTSETEVVEEKGISAGTQTKIEKWKKEIYKEFPSKRLSPDNFRKYDFSLLWVNEYNFCYIGTNFQRMYMTFQKVSKVSDKEYCVSGFSSVKNNYCDFSGTFKILEYNQLKKFQEIDDSDSEIEDKYVKNQCYLFAEFSLSEDENQKSSGHFSGILFTKFWIDNNDAVHLLDVMYGNDVGNLYLGEWTNYKNKVSKPVGWGDGEIPLARGILYHGDGDICISAKYYDNGWEEFQVCDPE
jgi:hypothetical protein